MNTLAFYDTKPYHREHLSAPEASWIGCRYHEFRLNGKTGLAWTVPRLSECLSTTGSWTGYSMERLIAKVPWN